MADRVGHGIEIKHLYKIFGEKAAGLVDAVKGGMSKTALIEQHSHDVGPERHQHLDARRLHSNHHGPFRVGKPTLIRHINRLIEQRLAKCS